VSGSRPSTSSRACSDGAASIPADEPRSRRRAAGARDRRDGGDALRADRPTPVLRAGRQHANVRWRRARPTSDP
jgi:hypothetical protein